MTVREQLEAKYKKATPAMTVRQQLEQKYGKQNAVVQEQPQQTEQPQPVQNTDKGFLGNLAGDIKKRGLQAFTGVKKSVDQAKDTYGISLGQIPLRVAGAFGGLVGDTAGEVIKKALPAVKTIASYSPPVQLYKSLDNDKNLLSMSADTKKTIEDFAGKAGKGLSNFVGNKYNEFKTSNPEIAQSAEDIVNMANIPLFGKPSVKAGAKVAEKGGQIAKKSITEGATNASKNLAGNLNKVFDESTQGIRKIVKFAGEKDINIGEEIAKRKISPVVKNERLTFDTKHLDDIENEIILKSKVVDEAAKAYPATKISTTELKKKSLLEVSKNIQLANEGRVKEIYNKMAKKIDDFAEQAGSRNFNLSQLQEFKKGMWSASKKFKLTDVGKTDAYSELGRVFRKIVEDEIPDVAIKGVNKEIGTAENLYKFLSKVDQSGGVVLKGGKMGKFFSGLTGSVVGAGLGSFSGPLGAALGAAVGSKASSIIRNLSQKSDLLGPIDRLLIKASKLAPDSEDLTNARKFIDNIKAGGTPTPTPRIEKIIKNLLFPEEPLKLPAPKAGSPKVQIDTPINLPPKSATTLDKESLKISDYDKIRQKFKFKPDNYKLLNKPGENTIFLPPKK